VVHSMAEACSKWPQVVAIEIRARSGTSSTCSYGKEGVTVSPSFTRHTLTRDVSRSERYYLVHE
jgi:hypothetical protein